MNGKGNPLKSSGHDGNLDKMGELAASMVMQKAMDDKMAIAKNMEQSNNNENLNNANYDEGDNEMDSDDSFDDEMDAEEMELLRKMKEKRLSEYDHIEDERKKRQKRNHDGVGEYIEIDEEKFMKYTTSQKFVVCHFYHQDFFRCKVLDKHFRQVAYMHPECKFYNLNVEKSPFIVEKLNIRVLPTIGVFIDGVLIESLTGFEEFGGTDNFQTLALIRRLAVTKVLKLREEEKFKMNMQKKKKIIYGADSESDSDY